MNKICYKVVTIGPNGGFASAASPELPKEYILTYCLGVKTIPKIGRIFVFDSLETAKNFLMVLFKNSFTDRAIFSGFAENVGCPKFVANQYMNGTVLNNFWMFKKRHKEIKWDYKGAPSGSRTCSSFTPIERVY